MPRRGRSSPSPTRSMSRPAPMRASPPPTRAAPRAAPPQAARAAPAPAAHPPAPVPPSAVGAPSQGPGLMAQMAATAGGVAIGSAAGHMIGHALTGGSGGGDANVAPAVPESQQQMAPQYQQTQGEGPCQFELKEFLNCTQNYDLSLCEGFNEVLKQCRMKQPSASMY